jgi:hypothetical protein
MWDGDGLGVPDTVWGRRMGFGGHGWNGFLVRHAPNCFGEALRDAAGDALRVAMWLLRGKEKGTSC